MSSLRSVHGGEFFSKQFLMYCARRGDTRLINISELRCDEGKLLYPMGCSPRSGQRYNGFFPSMQIETIQDLCGFTVAGFLYLVAHRLDEDSSKIPEAQRIRILLHIVERFDTWLIEQIGLNGEADMLLLLGHCHAANVKLKNTLTIRAQQCFLWDSYTMPAVNSTTTTNPNTTNNSPNTNTPMDPNPPPRKKKKLNQPNELLQTALFAVAMPTNTNSANINSSNTNSSMALDLPALNDNDDSKNEEPYDLDYNVLEGQTTDNLQLPPEFTNNQSTKNLSFKDLWSFSSLETAPSWLERTKPIFIGARLYPSPIFVAKLSPAWRKKIRSDFANMRFGKKNGLSCSLVYLLF